MKTANRFTLSRVGLMACLLVLALGALPAGWLLFTRPDGSGMGMPLSMLAHSPFSSFAVPGLILFLLFGVGSLVTLYGLIARPRWAWTEPLMRGLHMHWSLAAAVIIGLGQMIWIVVQIAMLRGVSWLHPLFFLMGLAIVGLAYLDQRTTGQLDASQKLVAT